VIYINHQQTPIFITITIQRHHITISTLSSSKRKAAKGSRNNYDTKARGENTVAQAVIASATDCYCCSRCCNNAMSEQVGKSCKVKVAYVRKEEAKKVKTILEKAKLLDKRFRMAPADAAAAAAPNAQNWIAIPVVSSVEVNLEQDPLKDVKVEGFGYQICPYSTKMVGSGRRLVESSSGSMVDNLSMAQLVILNMSLNTSSEPDNYVLEKVQKLDKDVCPRHQLEVFGDDRTLIIPTLAFQGHEFVSLLRGTRRGTIGSTGDSGDSSTLEDNLMDDFWRRLAEAHRSSRIARKGAIDPNSKIRESGHRLVWPHSGIPETTGEFILLGHSQRSS
jgi:hypothetical protein